MRRILLGTDRVSLDLLFSHLSTMFSRKMSGQLPVEYFNRIWKIVILLRKRK